ncbi:MAG TPA: MopE-related protein, partial [Polyangiales bacterium]
MLRRAVGYVVFCLTALLLLPASSALAAPPPLPDFSTVTFTANGCSAGQLNDPTTDVQQHDARNIKGTAQEPALAMGEDSYYVYLRMRVEGDPRGNGACTTNSYMANSAGWAWLISADGTWNSDANKGYEGMVIISKSSNNIQVYGNDANILDNPSDPPNNLNYANAGAGYSLCTHLRITNDATSAIIDVAVLKSEFIAAINEGLPVGRKLSEPMRGAFTMWGGTTSNGTTISVDLTCTESAPGSAKLSTTAGPGITFGTYAKITSPTTGSSQGSTFTVTGTGQASTATNTIGMSVAFKSGATTKCTRTTSISTGGTWSVSSSGCGLSNGESITIEATATNSALTPAVTYTDSVTVSIAVDGDSDGVADVSDNCPSVANSNQADGDSDGVGNLCDNCASAANAAQTDSDSDGVGDACDNCAITSNAAQTNADGDAYGAACDCDDSNSAIRPNASEITGDGVDQNCDGQELCYRDADSDGYRPDSSTTVASSDSDCSDGGEALSSAPTTDCNDASAAVRPGLSDALCNGVDNDCDGATDENYVSASCATGQAGICSAGTQQCSTGVVTCVRTLTPSLDDSLCNGLDDDCSGQVDEDYAPSSCGTGLLGVCSAGTSQCSAGAESCGQNVAASGSDACDGLDNDCDGSSDENFVSASCSTGLPGICAAGTTQCSAGVPSCAQTTLAAASDASCNGTDDDCNGQVDEDYAPHATSCGVGACAASGTSSCVAGVEGSSCSAGSPAASDASCDGVDDDCDGQADEDYASQATSCGQGACAA